MSKAATETLSVVVEREIPFPPEKIWRALTQPHLIEEWLMKNDFKPAVDHRFTLRGDWGAVDCQILTIELSKTLSYPILRSSRSRSCAADCGAPMSGSQPKLVRSRKRTIRSAEGSPTIMGAS